MIVSNPQQLVSELRSAICVKAIAEESKSKIEKFDGSDFAYWKSQMEDYLYQKDLYRPLLGKEKGKKRRSQMVIGRYWIGRL